MNETGVPPQRIEPPASGAAGRDAVAVCDEVLERQLTEVARIAGEAETAEVALNDIVFSHAQFALEKQEYLATWRQEFRDLPAEDAWRLRRMQRLYVEEWAHVVAAVRSDLNDAEARAAVHAAIAVLHSLTEYQSGLSTEALAPLLTSMALAAVRGATPVVTPRM